MLTFKLEDETTSSQDVILSINQSDFRANLTNIYDVNTQTLSEIMKSVKNESQNMIKKNAFSIDPKSQAQIISMNNNFQGQRISSEGGYFWLNENVTLNENGSVFRDNAAVKGGALFCRNCSIIFNKTTFIDNIA